MINERLTHEELESLSLAMKSHFEVMAESGSEAEIIECSQIVRALCELQERRKAEKNSEPVVFTDERNLHHIVMGRETSLIWGKQNSEAGDVPLYRHAQTVVPATLPCSVELKPGLIIGKGCKTETLLTALRHRADYNADIDAMTPEERAKHDASIEAFKAMLPQPAPVVPEDNDELARLAEKFGAEVAWANEPNEFHHLIEFTPPQFRAAMLQAGNSPAIPEGYVMVPMRLTAENGAKGVLSGEFSETQFVNCPECFGDDECETCDGSGRIEITVPVTWTTIKEIWAKGVEHFAAAPQDVPDGK
ncbi:TPA: hypothetical protein I9232_004920 [Klebsiella oxytoca]|nr:hypothetical protein [Klebsiella oxytoca]